MYALASWAEESSSVPASIQRCNDPNNWTNESECTCLARPDRALAQLSELNPCTSECWNLCANWCTTFCTSGPSLKFRRACKHCVSDFCLMHQMERPRFFCPRVTGFISGASIFKKSLVVCLSDWFCNPNIAWPDKKYQNRYVNDWCDKMMHTKVFRC